MIVRLVARAEPYASYSTESSIERDSDESLSLFVGDQDDGRTFRDVTVVPALDLANRPEALRASSIHIAYGSVALMERAFACGCADYLREPWCMDELRSRIRRFSIRRFAIGDVEFCLQGTRLGVTGGVSVTLSEPERRLLRLFAADAGHFAARSALEFALWGEDRAESRALDMQISHMRRIFEKLSPGAGKAICAVRGLGYRVLCRTCG